MLARIGFLLSVAKDGGVVQRLVDDGLLVDVQKVVVLKSGVGVNDVGFGEVL